MTIDGKSINKRIENQIQQHTESLMYYKQFGFISRIQDRFNIKKKSINVIYPVNRIKEISHVIISIDTEKAFE